LHRSDHHSFVGAISSREFRPSTAREPAAGDSCGGARFLLPWIAFGVDDGRRLVDDAKLGSFLRVGRALVQRDRRTHRFGGPPRRGEDEGALMHGCGSRAATSRAGTRSLQTACQRLSHPRLDSIFGRPIQQAEEPTRVRPASHRHRHRRVSRSVPPTSALAGRDGCTHVTRVPFVDPADAGVRSVRHPVRHLGDTPPSCPGNRGGGRVPLRPFRSRARPPSVGALSRFMGAGRPGCRRAGWH